MSTATAPRQHQQRTENGHHKDAPALEQAIEQTNKQKSLVATAASVLGVPIDKLCDLLRNVWKTSKDQPPLTNQEMFVGISMIARYELDPIAREVYVTRGKGGIFTIISIDGWVKVLDRTDHYDGHTVEIHEEKPGVIDWVETTIYSKKRKYPTTYRAYAAEYAKIGGMVAKTIPSHMLRVFCLRHAARLFTPIGGTVLTEEEALFIARDEPPQTQREPIKTIDDLTASLTAPIAQEELPETSYEPAKEEAKQETKTEAPKPSQATSTDSTAAAWSKFVAELAAATGVTEARDACDRWFNPDCTVEFSPEQDTEAAKLRDKRIEEIHASRKSGGKPKQSTLMDTNETA